MSGHSCRGAVLADAAHAEYDPNASRLFVTPLECVIAGKTMRVYAEPLPAALALMRLAEQRSGLVSSADGADHHALRHPHT